eukprot:10344090-Lingulodinium_polyedra.AAC.1
MTFATGSGEGMPELAPAAEIPDGPHVDTRRPVDGRFRGTLLPGDLIVASLGQGAQVDLRAAGEHASVTLTCQAWLRVQVPEPATVRAAQADATHDVQLDIEGIR